MNAYELPTSLNVGGVDYEIRSDFRAVLDVLAAMNDPELDEGTRTLVMLMIIYPGWESIPAEHLGEAAKAACGFIDNAAVFGEAHADSRRTPKLYDWERDAGLIIPAVNGAAHTEVRALPYLHWWTFLGYFMEIGESLFTTVLGIRQKRARGRKLERSEQEFVRDNPSLFDSGRTERADAVRDEMEKFL